MAQAVSHRPLTTEARGSVPGQVHVRFVEDKVALGQFFSELSVLPCRFHSTGAPLIVKIGKKTAHPSIIIIGVAQKALRLWCVRSVSCGALHHHHHIFKLSHSK